jgi:PhoPQ-activated pathogenicity-related protein
VGDEIVVRAADEPDAVRLWQAHNDQARDFRLETIGPAWRAKRLAPKEKALYVARVAKPKAGWTAFFVELTYGMGEEPPLKCTTEVHVIPHTLPHADKLTAGACPAEKGGRK